MFTNMFYLHLYSYQNQKVTGNSFICAILGLNYYLFLSLVVIFLHSKLQFWSFSYIFVATSSNHVTWLHLKVNICGIAANKLKIAAL